MTIKALKKYLDDKNIVVEQWELTTIKLIKKQEDLFEISSKEIESNEISRKKFEKNLSKKLDAFGKSVDELSKYAEEIENLSNEELEKRGDQIIAGLESSKNFWNDEDKKEFDSIYSEFLEQQKKIIVTNRIFNIFLKYEVTKTIIQLIIFGISFFSSYYLGLILEPHFSYFNDISVQFFIAVILFATLEKLLDKLETYLVYWRVSKLFKYFTVLLFLTKKLKPKQ